MESCTFVHFRVQECPSLCMFVSNRHFNNKGYFIPWFRVPLKHCSSDQNNSRDLEFDKNVPRLVTTGAINFKKKQSEGNTLLCYEYLFYINTQVQMLKSFTSLLIQKFTVSAKKTSYQNFVSSPHYVREFFGGRWSCAGILRLQDIFFQNCPPPPPKVKWLAPNCSSLQKKRERSTTRGNQVERNFKNTCIF